MQWRKVHTREKYIFTIILKGVLIIESVVELEKLSMFI